MTAVLDKIAAGELLGRRQDMLSNQLLSHALEQLLARGKRLRDTEAATINMQLVTWRDGARRQRGVRRRHGRRAAHVASTLTRISRRRTDMRRLVFCHHRRRARRSAAATRRSRSTTRPTRHGTRSRPRLKQVPARDRSERSTPGSRKWRDASALSPICAGSSLLDVPRWRTHGGDFLYANGVNDALIFGDPAGCRIPRGQPSGGERESRSWAG